MMKRIFGALAALLLLPAIAGAQSSPGWYQGFVPTPGQWNAMWSSKQDTLGYSPLNRSGDTMLGPLRLTAATASASGFNIGVGIAPTNPNNGDVWMTSSGFYARFSGTTYNFVALPPTGVSGGIPYYASTTSVASSSLLASSGIVVGGGAGLPPHTLGSLGTTTQVLHGNALGDPTWGAIVAADLPATVPLTTTANLFTGTQTFSVASGSNADVVKNSSVGGTAQWARSPHTNTNGTDTDLDWYVYAPTVGNGYRSRWTADGLFGFGDNNTPVSTLETHGSFGASIRTVTNTASAGVADSTILCDATGGGFTITIPNADATNAKRIYRIKKIDTSSATCTIASNAIDNQTSQALTVPYQRIAVQSDGSKWWILE